MRVRSPLTLSLPAEDADRGIVRSRSLLRVLLAVIALAPQAVAIPVAPSKTEVLALDDYFLPSLDTVPRGGTVVWDFSDAERSHTATYSSAMGLFDSGLVSPGGHSFERIDTTFARNVRKDMYEFLAKYLK